MPSKITLSNISCNRSVTSNNDPGQGTVRYSNWVQRRQNNSSNNTTVIDPNGDIVLPGDNQDGSDAGTVTIQQRIANRVANRPTTPSTNAPSGDATDCGCNMNNLRLRRSRPSSAAAANRRNTPVVVRQTFRNTDGITGAFNGVISAWQYLITGNPPTR